MSPLMILAGVVLAVVGVVVAGAGKDAAAPPERQRRESRPPGDAESPRSWWSQTATVDGRARVQRDVLTVFAGTSVGWVVCAWLTLTGELSIVGLVAWTGVVVAASAVALVVCSITDEQGLRAMNGEDDPAAHARRVEAALRRDERDDSGRRAA